MNKAMWKCVLISDFNINNLSAYLENDPRVPAIHTTVAPYGQVVPTLLDEGSDAWADRPDFAVVWTRPEGVIESFAAALECRRPPVDQVLAEVKNYAEALVGIRERVGFVLVPSWVVPTYHRGWGLIDLKEAGVTSLLWQMNLYLAEKLREAANLYVLNAQRWIEAAGVSAFNPKFWYMGKIPFDIEVFKQAVGDMKAAVRAVSGQARKLIVLDLDDTLWGGIVGEVGWHGLKLGGHDPIGEAFVDFQKALKTLQNRGIVLAIVSKNEESVAREAIREHPEMLLRLEDFVSWRINWEDKARNLADLVAELNLGLQSVVFIDDNPAERARIREALPEVFVPDWPDEKMLYAQALLSLNCFDASSVSNEDLKRTEMYVSEQQRKQLEVSLGSLDEWLGSLDLRVTIEELSDANLKRTVQLLNKTNQMNLTTRRMTDIELVAWLKQGQRKLWSFSVSDRFGHSGLTGITSVECNDKKGRIVDFVLSCRVFGRQIEKVMVHTAVAYAQRVGVEQIEAKYLPTPKNKPCMEFWRNSGFEHDQENDIFCWDVSKPYRLPGFIVVHHLG
jgi:FkbH-like protein